MTIFKYTSLHVQPNFGKGTHKISNWVNLWDYGRNDQDILLSQSHFMKIYYVRVGLPLLALAQVAPINNYYLMNSFTAPDAILCPKYFHFSLNRHIITYAGTDI